MPIYEYKCEACGRVFEELVMRTGGEEETACPECGCAETKRLVSSFSSAGGSSGDADGAAHSCGSGGGGGFT
ncbi:MAG: zinc ribbon domain-containing protein [Pseudomonadota bacterium]